MFEVGDMVEIRKPKNTEKINGKYSFRWLPEMDSYDGLAAEIIGAHQSDDGMHWYDLSVDDSEFGWLHIYLTKVKS